MKLKLTSDQEWVRMGDLEQLIKCDAAELKIIIEDLCLEIRRLKVAAAETTPTDSI